MSYVRLLLLIALASLGFREIAYATTPESAVVNSAMIHTLLGAGRFEELDRIMNGVQRNFQEGRLTEYQLRAAFRPLYDLTPTEVQKLVEWTKSYPASYAAHLALGTYYKREGRNARGTKSAKDTPQEKFEEMYAYFKIANKELTESLRLTKSPYLSIFHLMDIAGIVVDREWSDSLMKQADSLLKYNRLVRGRYFDYLAPRWGGSYDQMRTYIKSAEKNGYDKKGLLQLEAFLYSEIGEWTYISNGYSFTPEVALNMEKALDLLYVFDDDPDDKYLVRTLKIYCKKRPTAKYCTKLTPP